MNTNKIIIVGAGAAGLIAALQASKSGAKVLILEKMNRAGIKLSITGKGRCNLTNIAPLEEFINHFGKNGQFLRQIFSTFFSDDLLKLFEKNNFELQKERGGRIFPAKNKKAPDIVKFFLKKLNEHKVEVLTNSAVTEIIVEDNVATGVIVNDKTYKASKIIFCTGGASYPLTGSSGESYSLLTKIGHSIKKIRPALVPLKVERKLISLMKNVHLKNINAKLLINNKKKKELVGELEIRDRGLEGPIPLTFSLDIIDALAKNKKAAILLDLKPGLSEEKLNNRLLRDFKERGNESFSNILRGLLPKEMIPVCLNQLRINPDIKGCNISKKDRIRLKKWLKEFSIEIEGNAGLKYAIITAGGIKLSEINPKTLESKIVKGLFIAGEVLDIQADTGGYNLQAAFSTGYVAAQNAVDSLLK